MPKTDQHGNPIGKPKKNTRSNYQTDVVWCSLALTENQKAAFTKFMAEKPEALDGELHTWLEDGGNRLSIAFDAYSSCYRVSMMASADDRKNAGKILTARSPNIWRAVWIAVYKHAILFDGDWVPDAPSGDRDWEG